MKSGEKVRACFSLELALKKFSQVNQVVIATHKKLFYCRILLFYIYVSLDSPEPPIVFLPVTFTALKCIGGNRKSYTRRVENWSDLPPGPTLWSTGVIKS